MQVTNILFRQDGFSGVTCELPPIEVFGPSPAAQSSGLGTVSLSVAQLEKSLPPHQPQNNWFALQRSPFWFGGMCVPVPDW